MNPRRGITASLALACTALPAAAQPVPPPPRLATLPAAPAAPAAAAPTSSASASLSVGAPASAPAAPAPAASASASAGNVRVIEDDQVRIEESRDARGQLQRVTVKSKVGGKSYEIIVPPGGKDNSQARGTSGQAAWRLFDF